MVRSTFFTRLQDLQGHLQMDPKNSMHACMHACIRTVRTMHGEVVKNNNASNTVSVHARWWVG